MVGERFVLPSWGEQVVLRLAEGPGGPARELEDDARYLLQGLLADWDQPRVQSALRTLHYRLTGERLPQVVDLFHVDGEILRGRLERSLGRALSRGRLELQRQVRPRAQVRVEQVERVAPEMRPQAEQEKFGDFGAQILDHTGAPVANLPVTLSIAGRPTNGKTDGSGIVKFERFTQSFASLKLKAADIQKTLQPVWDQGLPRARFTGSFAELRFRPEMPDVQLELGRQQVIVLQPEMGRLVVELRDKSGRRAHSFVKYSISGPLSLDGETTESGQLVHEDIPPGDYQLEFTQLYEDELKLKPGEAKHKTQLVVLGESQGGLQSRWLGAIPDVRMARLRGFVFDTNKSFLLPTAIPGLTKIRDEYERSNPSRLLIVGHTDTSGEPAYNEKLSKERAESVQQYLTDDVDAWLKNYDQSDTKKKWGTREDRLMMTQLEGFLARPPDEPPTLWYQKHHNVRADAKGRPKLKEDGKVGPKTRGELVRDYMALDGVTLSEQEGFLIDIEVLGCGENFPLGETGNDIDTRLAAERDGERDALDRRVELFFFDDEFGVTPKASGPKGEEYLVWRKRSATLHDEDVAPARQKATVVSVPSAHFRSGSAVLLPEGEAPTTGTSTALSGVGMLAMALRFNQMRPGHSMLLGGHADSVGSDKANDELSTQRAELTHAVLTGNRAKFVEIATQTGKVSDWKQIFRWASASVPGFEATAPSAIDDNATTGKPAAEAFQRAYNTQKTTLGARSDNLEPDGVVGRKTWGAVFDLYQWNLADELGEVEQEADLTNGTKLIDGLKELQGATTFLPTSKPFVGFGEHFPSNGIGKNNVALEANRRVDLMFFESGNEPDVGILEEAPEVSELYQANSFEQVKLTENDLASNSLVVQYEETEGAVDIREARMTLKPLLAGDAQGSIEASFTDDEEARARTFLFEDVPLGTYELWTQVGKGSFCTFRRVNFRRQGIFIEGVRAGLGIEPPSEPAEPIELAQLDDDLEPLPPDR